MKDRGALPRERRVHCVEERVMDHGGGCSPTGRSPLAIEEFTA
jgi:hypothetical protein